MFRVGSLLLFYIANPIVRFHLQFQSHLSYLWRIYGSIEVFTILFFFRINLVQYVVFVVVGTAAEVSCIQFSVLTLFFF